MDYRAEAHPARLPWQMNAGAQPAKGRCLETDVAAVAARHVSRNRQPEPDAASRQVARCIEANKRAKYALAFQLGNTGTVIVNRDIETVIGRGGGQPDVPSVTAR